MIFVTVGTCFSFHRLIKHIDNLEISSNEKNSYAGWGFYLLAEKWQYERYYSSIDRFIENARVVISHGGFSCVEIIKKNKPLIIVPRRKEYSEHFNNHQVEFAELLNLKFGIPYFLDFESLTADYIEQYSYVAKFSSENLMKFQDKIVDVL